MLDTGDANPSTGGRTICLTKSTDTNSSRQSLILGERRTTEAVDSPGDEVPFVHPKGGGVKQCIINFNFRSFLVAWTGTSTGSGNEPGATLYNVVEEVPWGIGLAYTFVDPGQLDN